MIQSDEKIGQVGVDPPGLRLDPLGLAITLQVNSAGLLLGVGKDPIHLLARLNAHLGPLCLDRQASLIRFSLLPSQHQAGEVILHPLRAAEAEQVHVEHIEAETLAGPLLAEPGDGGHDGGLRRLGGGLAVAGDVQPIGQRANR